uniref:Uncharacterized protein n=1 Tax=Sphaerodactylus townsendi TaxID=933632 RepID=A0ACB8F9G8_9SAUR
MMAVMSGSRDPLGSSEDRHGGGGGCRARRARALAEEAAPSPRRCSGWAARRPESSAAAPSPGVARPAPRTGPAAAPADCGDSGEGPAEVEGAGGERKLLLLQQLPIVARLRSVPPAAGRRAGFGARWGLPADV